MALLNTPCASQIKEDIHLFYVAVIIKTLNCVGCVENQSNSLKAGVLPVFLTCINEQNKQVNGFTLPLPDR